MRKEILQILPSVLGIVQGSTSPNPVDPMTSSVSYERDQSLLDPELFPSSVNIP